jgi:probable lipoprotein NlpC
MLKRIKTYARFLLVLVSFSLLISCSSRRPAVKTTAAAANMADAMANLNSKALYRFITDWTGVRYKLGGLDKSGIDCSGFALLLQKEIYNVALPRRSRDQAEKIREKQLNQLKEGDLIFFSFNHGEVDHVGIYLNNKYFVHASTTRGVVVDDLTMPAYQNAFVKAGSFKN